MEHHTSSPKYAPGSRDDYPGSRHHVMARGGSRRDIFDGPESRYGFLALLRELKPRFGVCVHGYALMGNHYHLLVSSHRGKLSAAMKYLNSTHARRFNRRVQHDGPLFRGRFASRSVEDERYWVYLLAYVHLNPLKDGFARDVASIRWTSHPHYMGRVDTDFVHVDEHLALLHGQQGYRHLIEGVSSEEIGEPEGFEVALAQFPEPMSARVGGDRSIGDARMALRGLPIDLDGLRRLTGSRSTNTARWLTWWIDSTTTIQRAELARLIGISRATVTRRVWAVEQGKAGPRPEWLAVDPPERVLQLA